jgi:IS5 family transposase
VTQDINGYKRHIAVDVDSELILARAVTPANRPEETALPALEEDLARQRRRLTTLCIDRGEASPSPLQQRLRESAATPVRRMRLRTRALVEHRLAHLARRQGRRARYRGVRKNLFDLHRASSVLNLEAIHRQTTRAAKAAS